MSQRGGANMIIKSDNITDLKIDSLKNLYKLRPLIEGASCIL
mgnify:FL=1